VFDPTLHGDPLPLNVAGTYQLYAKAQPENATDKRLTYISDNEAIASVNSVNDEGLITT